MRIAIEAIGIDKPGGGRTSILNLLLAMFNLDRANEYRVYLTAAEEQLNAFSNVEQYVVPTQNRFSARAWAQFHLPGQLRQFDLVHFTKNMSVFGLTIPHVITVHDLTTLKLPGFFPLTDTLYWQTVERVSIHAATKVIAISQDTANDLVQMYKLPSERIQVIHHGVSSQFYPRTVEEVARVKEKYTIQGNYLITVGRIDLKKNLPTLVRAFSRLKREGEFPGKLILVGEIYKKCEDKELVPTIQRLGLDQEVLFLGRVPDEDLPALYSGAVLCPFPSVHEGFGLVGLEAMACGVPVVTHHSSGITEVVADAGIMVDAHDEGALYAAIRGLLTQPDLQARMRKLGLERAAQFSWRRAAEMTLAVYQESLQKCPQR